MGRADRHVGKCPGDCNKAAVTDGEGDLSLEDVEAFLFPAVDMWRRTAARWHDGLPQRVLAVGVLARGQKSVHVSDDRNCAALARLRDDRLCHARLLFRVECLSSRPQFPQVPTNGSLEKE